MNPTTSSPASITSDSEPRGPRPYARGPRPTLASRLGLGNRTEFGIADVELLRALVSEHGKILPRRQTGLSAVQQRRVARAIKQARVLALLPFSEAHR